MVVAGVESVPPIPVRTATGPLLPALPAALAEVPGGTAENGANPFIRADALTDAEWPSTVTVRLYDASLGRGDSAADNDSDYVWQGSLTRGWGRVTEQLVAGHGYALWGRQPSGVWRPLGRFGVRGTVDASGPTTQAGGLSVSLATGELGWTWDSPNLAGPAAGVGVGLQWLARSPKQVGLPDGWRLMVSSGSPWASLSEAGVRLRSLRPPSAPAVTRVSGQSAQVRFAYPLAGRIAPGGFVLQQRVGIRWIPLRVSGGALRPGVRLATLAVGASAVRVGVANRGVTVFSRPALVRSAGAPPVMVTSPVDVDQCGSATNSVAAPEAVVLHGWSGMSLTFRRNDFGVYEQAIGGDKIPGYRNTLGFCDTPAGRTWTFTDASGIATRFTDGRATTVTNQGQPVSTLTWVDNRLVRLANGVGRSMGLVYAGGSTTCPSADWSGYSAPPTGSLCRLEYPGGVATDLGYLAAGLPSPQISLVKDPGNSATTLGWDEVGRLVATRSPLVNRAATVEPVAAAAIATAAYDGLGRVASVTEAPGSVGAASATQSFALPVIGEAQLKARAPVTSRVTSTATGYETFNEATLDPVTLDQSVSRDAAGSQTTTSTSGRTTTSTDARGLVTTTTFDSRGNVVSQQGPVMPAQSSPGTDLTAKYDTVDAGSEDREYEGFRALVYGRERFQGGVTPDHWKPRQGNGLAAAWTVQSDTMSAVATALWTPTADQDAAAKAAGWTFEVSAVGGASVKLIIEGAVCEETTCTIARLPKGTKQVTVEVERGPSEGWFTLLAAPGGTRPTTVPAAQVRPGFGNLTSVRSNDVTAAQNDPVTEYAYDRPETGKITRAAYGGGLSATLEYESGAPGQGRWGRLLRFTTPGGRVQRTSYWRDGGAVAMPDVCGGTAAMSGQPRTITRQDGIAVTSFYDVRGRLIASVTTGDGGVSETVCTAYSDDGVPLTSSLYDDEGALVERVETVVGVDGDPLTVQQTVTHGPAAAIDPGAVVFTSITNDLRGNPVLYVDATGTVTTTSYTPFSDPAHVTVTPPGANSPLLTFDYAYRREDAAPTTVTVNGVLAAEVTYADGKSTVDHVAYAGGAARLALQYAASGRPSTIVATAGSSSHTQTLEFNDFGRILSARISSRVGGQTSTEARGYAYDAAGRLASAIISSTPAGASVRRTTYGYGFAATQSATCGEAAAAYPRAAADALRTGGTRAGVAYVMCHNSQGRLYSTSDPLVTGDATGTTRASLAHDALGRVTAVTGVARPMQFTWGAGSSVARVVEGSGGDAVTTVLDTFGGQVVSKTVETPADSQTVRYAYSSPMASSPLLTLPPERGPPGGIGVSYPLPGGVRVDAAPGEVPQLTFTGLDGSAFASVVVPTLVVGGVSGPTVPNTGLLPRFGPFGEALVTPSLTATGARPAYTWQASQHHETLAGTSSLVLLGARTYFPALGEFLSPDPKSESGTNLYSYTPADPINGSDPTGQANGWSWFWQVISAVLIVAAIAVDVVTMGMATPATGAGVAAWVGYIGLTVGVPMVAWWAVGKAQEMSLRAQTDPSEGLDSFRAAIGWAQLIENVGMSGTFIISVGLRAAGGVKSWWRNRSLPKTTLTEDLEIASALGSARRSVALPQTQHMSFGVLDNGGRETLERTTGRLSVGSSRITGNTLRMAADRKTFFHIADFTP